MKTVIGVLMVPLIFINLFGDLISAIWLAVLGQWWAIGYGVLLLFSTLVLGIVMTFGLVFSAPAVALIERGRTILAFPLLFLSQVYTYAIITIWCTSVFIFFMSHTDRGTFWPLLIWSYGVALGPWEYMAQQELQGGVNEYSSMTTFFAQIGYILIAVILILAGGTFFQLATVFTAIMLVGMLIQTSAAYASL